VRLLPATIACVSLVATAACANTTTRVAPVSATAGAVAPSTSASGPDADISVGVIVLENKEFDHVIGSKDAPYLNALAGRSALATSFYAEDHPSLPNYLAMTGGDTFGVTSDCTTCHVSADNLAAQLSKKKIPWRAYMEGMPRPCFAGAFSRWYAKKHNPFAYFDNVRTDESVCSNVVPLSRWTADRASSDLPRFVWITPDQCSDMHSCSVKTGDTFMKRWVPKVLDALGPRGVLFITFDEGTTRQACCAYASGGRIATIVTGPLARPGTYPGALDHYSILREIEDIFSLARLGHAAASDTPSLDGLLNRQR